MPNNTQKSATTSCESEWFHVRRLLKVIAKDNFKKLAQDLDKETLLNTAKTLVARKQFREIVLYRLQGEKKFLILRGEQELLAIWSLLADVVPIPFAVDVTNGKLWADKWEADEEEDENLFPVSVLFDQDCIEELVFRAAKETPEEEPLPDWFDTLPRLGDKFSEYRLSVLKIDNVSDEAEAQAVFDKYTAKNAKKQVANPRGYAGYDRGCKADSRKGLVAQLPQARDEFCGLGTRKTKLLLNKLAKDNPLAAAYRIALEIEDCNIQAKACSIYKYREKIYHKKGQKILELANICLSQEYPFGTKPADVEGMTHIVYFHLPGCEQISFHAILTDSEAQGLPRYIAAWDGKLNSTIPKLDLAISTVFAEEIKHKLEKQGVAQD